MIFVDTNYFIRYLLGDIPSQSETAKALFLEGSEGKIKLFTSTIVIFEVFWVFTDFYKKTKEEVIEILFNVLSMNFIEIKERDIIRKAIEFYKEKNIEFEDCYNLAYAKANKMTRFATFDKKLSKYI